MQKEKQISVMKHIYCIVQSNITTVHITILKISTQIKQLNCAGTLLDRVSVPQTPVSSLCQIQTGHRAES